LSFSVTMTLKSVMSLKQLAEDGFVDKKVRRWLA
jgi:hypothetical protein